MSPNPDKRDKCLIRKIFLKKQEIFTPDYESLLKINDLVNNDTWQLFFDMQLYNPYAKKIRKDLLVALKNLDSKL